MRLRVRVVRALSGSTCECSHCEVPQSLMCCVVQSSVSSLVFTFCFCPHLLLPTLCPNSHTVLVRPTLSRSHSFQMFFTVFSRHLRCGIYILKASGISRFFCGPLRTMVEPVLFCAFLHLASLTWTDIRPSNIKKPFLRPTNLLPKRSS